MWCKKVIGYLEPCRSKLACALPYYCIIDYCFHVLRRGLVRAIRRKHPDVEIESLVFHQGNAPAHRALDPSWQSTFEGSNDSIIHHFHPISLPTCSLKRAVQKAFGTLSEDWFSQMYVKWVRRHEKCVRAKSEYFEKNWKKVTDMTSFQSVSRRYDGVWFVCIF